MRFTYLSKREGAWWHLIGQDDNGVLMPMVCF